jgi:hypothetical protein
MDIGGAGQCESYPPISAVKAPIPNQQPIQRKPEIRKSIRKRHRHRLSRINFNRRKIGKKKIIPIDRQMNLMRDAQAMGNLFRNLGDDFRRIFGPDLRGRPMQNRLLELRFGQGAKGIDLPARTQSRTAKNVSFTLSLSPNAARPNWEGSTHAEILDLQFTIGDYAKNNFTTEGR